MLVSNFIDDTLHSFLWWLTETFPSRTRDISRDGKLYLRRFYLTPRRLDDNGDKTDNYMGFKICLHYFYSGDEDRELHNHPWKRAVSFILTAGYTEERRLEYEDSVICVTTKRIKPRRFNVIGANDFHRISKIPGRPHIWTLFFTGSRAQDWGFWHPETGIYTSHAQFVTKYDQGYVKLEE